MNNYDTDDYKESSSCIVITDVVYLFMSIFILLVLIITTIKIVYRYWDDDEIPRLIIFSIITGVFPAVVFLATIIINIINKRY